WLAEQLNISPEEAQLILELRAENIARSPLHEDITETKLPFYVVAKLSDTSVCQSLQAGIITYLKNNPLNLERRRVNVRNLKDRLAFLQTQLAWMDSIKWSYNQSLKTGLLTKKEGEDMGIDKLFSLSDQFFNEMLGVRSGLESYESVELLLGFNPSGKYENPYLIHFLFKYLVYGMVCSLLIILWLAIPERSTHENTTAV
ncbi:MAG: hypothetical protein LPK45_11470, partial [Bacteroidota bacterium]|nr:hypothetical protein [Bacteroidota bacterium]MDX5431726.1 hypothetical protein [Bacteroidota bacterium]MDX5470441.1 hypothetical protein [Bacteroidota bacterium]